MNNFLYKILILIKWNKKIFPVILQNFYNKKILTLVWINKFCLIESFFYKKPCYWSRSKQKFWRKGYFSNNIQIIKNINFDCDLDALIFNITFFNKTCHYNLISCFNYNL
ncbi:phosphoribosyl-AMP cyclohydrolase [Candidatus Carsonella ruddii]|uniref:phosphoribosyl-AMP cyclohydrolase n=1 Tax=Carsonella ruddii TaxID=114186 RepID=UPI003D9A10DE